MPGLVKIQVKSNITLVKRDKENLRRAVPVIAKGRLRDAAIDLKKRMSKAGKPMGYPVPWVSDAQRIKVIIKIMKRQGELPYKRSKDAQRSWSVSSKSNGYAVSTSLGRIYKHIYGNPQGLYQSPIHTGRWPKLAREAKIVIEALPKSVKGSMLKAVRAMPQKPSVE